MFSIHHKYCVALGAAVIAAVSQAPAYAYVQPIYLEMNQSYYLPQGSAIKRVAVTNPEIADVAVVDKRALNVIGKKQNVAEWAWTFEGTAQYDATRSQAYTLTGAGYGTFSKGLYRSFSGNFAGTAKASYDLKTKPESTPCACDPSQVWDCTDLTTLVDADTVAFGTWTAKYDASASKKYLANGFLNVPSYAQ